MRIIFQRSAWFLAIAVILSSCAQTAPKCTNGSVLSIAASTKKSLVYTIDSAGFINAINLKNGECVENFKTWSGASDISAHATVGVNGFVNWLYVFDFDKWALVREIKTGDRIVPNYVQAVSLSRDGSIALVSDNDGVVSVWDLKGGFKRTEFKGALPSFRHAVMKETMLISPDTTVSLVAFRRSQFVTVWSTESGQRLRTIEMPSKGVRFGFFLGNKVAQLFTIDNKVVLVNVNSGELVNSYILPVDSPVTTAKVSLSNTWFVTGHVNGTIAAWDVETGSLIEKIKVEDTAVEAVALLHIENVIVWAGLDGKIHKVELKSTQKW